MLGKCFATTSGERKNSSELVKPDFARPVEIWRSALPAERGFMQVLLGLFQCRVAFDPCPPSSSISSSGEEPKSCSDAQLIGIGGWPEGRRQDRVGSSVGSRRGYVSGPSGQLREMYQAPRSPAPHRKGHPSSLSATTRPRESPCLCKTFLNGRRISPIQCA